MIRYVRGAELPDTTFEWVDDDGAIIDFSTGWAFEVRVGLQGREAVVVKTSGITGDSVLPNLTISWDPGELDDAPEGRCALQLTATTDSRRRRLVVPILFEPAIS